MKILALLAILTLTACDIATPIKSDSAPDNATLKADFLGTVDGCKIFRLHDDYDVYFAHCPTGAAQTKYVYHYGKGQSRRVQTI